MKTTLILMSMILVVLLSFTGCRAVENAIKIPQVNLYVNINGLSSGGLEVNLEARIDNPYPVTIEIGNLEVIAKGETGHIYIQDAMLGGSIAPNSSKTFTHGIVIPVDVVKARNMIVTVNSSVGAAGVNLPITATITVSTPNISDLINAPAIALSVNIGQLSSNVLDATLQANISNQNPLSLDIGDMQIVVKGKSGNVITSCTITGGSIAPNSSGTFKGSIMIPLQVLNERNIVVTADSKVGIAGISLPINATVTIEVPKLASLISVPEVEVYPHWPKLRLPPAPPSAEFPATVEVSNDNDIGLILGDIKVMLCKPNGQLVKTATVAGVSIPLAGTRTFERSIILGLEVLELIGCDEAILKLDTELGINGINERIPINLVVHIPLTPWP